jgi:hypothetical protein
MVIDYYLLIAIGDFTSAVLYSAKQGAETRVVTQTELI